MITGVPGVPVFPFPGLVEVGGKAGVPGLFCLIQVYDHRCSWWPQSFPFQDQLRPVAMVKSVLPVRSSSSRCMIAGVLGVSSLFLSMIG